jgi:hypothetical protein
LFQTQNSNKTVYKFENLPIQLGLSLPQPITQFLVCGPFLSFSVAGRFLFLSVFLSQRRPSSLLSLVLSLSNSARHMLPIAITLCHRPSFTLRASHHRFDCKGRVPASPESPWSDGTHLAAHVGPEHRSRPSSPTSTVVSRRRVPPV